MRFLPRNWEPLAPKMDHQTIKTKKKRATRRRRLRGARAPQQRALRVAPREACPAPCLHPPALPRPAAENPRRRRRRRGRPPGAARVRSTPPLATTQCGPEPRTQRASSGNAHGLPRAAGRRHRLQPRHGARHAAPGAAERPRRAHRPLRRHRSWAPRRRRRRPKATSAMDLGVTGGRGSIRGIRTCCDLKYKLIGSTGPASTS